MSDAAGVFVFNSKQYHWCSSISFRCQQTMIIILESQKCKLRELTKIGKNQDDKGQILSKLTFYCLNYLFRRFSGHSLRKALFVYTDSESRVTTLIGNFFLMIPS